MFLHNAPCDVLVQSAHHLTQGMAEEDFRRIMAVDKKVLDGQLRLILLQGALGGCVVTGDFSKELLEETLQHFCNK